MILAKNGFSTLESFAASTLTFSVWMFLSIAFKFSNNSWDYAFPISVFKSPLPTFLWAESKVLSKPSSIVLSADYNFSKVGPSFFTSSLYASSSSKSINSSPILNFFYSLTPSAWLIRQSVASVIKMTFINKYFN